MRAGRAGWAEWWKRGWLTGGRALWGGLGQGGLGRGGLGRGRAGWDEWGRSRLTWQRPARMKGSGLDSSARRFDCDGAAGRSPAGDSVETARTGRWFGHRRRVRPNRASVIRRVLTVVSRPAHRSVPASGAQRVGASRARAAPPGCLVRGGGQPLTRWVMRVARSSAGRAVRCGPRRGPRAGRSTRSSGPAQPSRARAKPQPSQHPAPRQKPRQKPSQPRPKP